MADRRYRAPDYYGAWVGGQYYNPGSFLPAGTQEYRVVDIENLSGNQYGWRTVQEVFQVGTTRAEIDEAMAELFSDLAHDYGITE